MTYDIYLGDNCSHFFYGYGYGDIQDENWEPLNCCITQWVLCDSVVVGLGAKSLVPLYPIVWSYVPGVIWIREWDKRIEKMVFRNRSDYDIYIYGYAYLAPGEECEIWGDDKREQQRLPAPWKPAGLGRLIATNDDDAQTYVGTFGLILSQSHMCDIKSDFKFVAVDFLRGLTSVEDGFAISNAVFFRDELCSWQMRTENGYYIFSNDARADQITRQEEFDALDAWLF